MARQVGEKASWQWNDSRTSGKIVQIYTERVTKTLQGSEITRNGSDDCPVYLIEQADGDRVLKLESELL